MRSWSLLVVAPVVATFAIGIAAAADNDRVPLFTSEDLDRMFGPAPAQPSDPVDKSRPEDWRWIEEFLDRQYSRIEADRQFDLSSRAVDIAAGTVEPPPAIYQRPVAWSLGYPGSTWWDAVWSKYRDRTDRVACCARDGRFVLASVASHGRDHGRGADRHPSYKAR
jgi:hypothetical protein